MSTQNCSQSSLENEDTTPAKWKTSTNEDKWRYTTSKIKNTKTS